ncbi:chemotaxis protein CheX [Legionella dresdenensis]|uniref:Chemotaxis protein CheX n=1 Tax=Legionella dresdenensis TaxID=450200 RepID=A0ABV8CHX2_9GAMM
MNNDQLLVPWLQASVEAFCDFVSQSFFIEEVIDPANLQIEDAGQLKNTKNLEGSAIDLSINDKKIRIYFLANQETLSNIAARILYTDVQEIPEYTDIIDAIKEMTNVIAGGVKSRLSAEAEGEIVLGLPVYIKQIPIEMDEKNMAILGKFNLNEGAAYFLINFVL